MVGKYPVKTLCESTRFKEQFLEAQKRLTLEGNIVISVGLFGHSGDDEVWTEGTKEMLDDMREVFRTGDKNYTIEMGMQAWKEMCMKWGKGYLSIRRLADNEDVAFYFTYLNYAPQIQSMIYTTNWIERLQKDFRRVTRMRGAMPDENSVIVLMGKTAMDKESYQRVIPRIREDATLFPVGSASKGD